MDPSSVALFAETMKESMTKALDRRSDWSPEDLIKKAMARDMLIWGVIRGDEFIGHVSAYVRNDELVIVTLGGEDAKEWMPLVQEHLLELLRHGYYSKIVTGARLGMQKWLKELGWKTVRVIMELE